MNVKQKLLGVKITHTIIWIFFNLIIAYLIYAAIVNKIDKFVWIAIGLILTEGLILLLFNNTCPLTIIARKYSDSSRDNFDIFLPNWLAKYTKIIYTTISIVVVAALIFRKLNR